MSNWIKTAGISGAIILSLAFVAGLGLVSLFPDLSTDLSAQADSKWGSILVILALIVTLLKQIIGFIGFLTTIIKIGIILLFVALLLGVGIMILRTWKTSQTSKE